MATQAILTTDKAIITTSESQNAIPNSLKQIEKRAQALVDNWHSACTKLADQRNEVETIQEAFDELGPGETILECRSFKMFCIRWLKRHPSSVYKMLAKARLQDADPDADESMDESEDTNLSGVNITDDDVPELDETDNEAAAEDSSEDDDGEKEEDTSTATTKSSSKSTQKRVHPPTANRAICTDFAKLILPILLNAPTDATKEQIHDKAREQAILFAENYPELVAELRLPDGFTLKPRIAELEEEIDQLKAEHEAAKQKIVDNFRQRIEALSSVPDHLRDETITATLAVEPDRDKASDILKQYFVTIAPRILPPHMALNTADALPRIHVLFAGRDHRIMIGDWLEKKGVEDHPPTLCKCTAVADYMQRRRVREWVDGKWGKDCVVYSGDESSYWVVTEARARELAPEAFGPPPDPPSTSKVEQEVLEGEGTAAPVTVIGDDEPKIGDKGGRTDHYYWEVVKSETLPFLIRTVIDDQPVKQCKSKEKAEASISLYEKNLASAGGGGSKTTQQPQDTGKGETYEDRRADGADRRPVVS